VTLRIGVVGAGILGLAAARRLLELRPDADLTVFEKEPRVAAHQTGHNSGVAHAGLYYAEGSLKARLCRRGMGLLQAYCSERGIPYEECGKTVVALDESEIDGLREIERRATANGVPDLRWLRREEIAEVEPHVVGAAGLHSPRTAIVDFSEVSASYARDVEDAGGRLRLGDAVVDIRSGAQEVVVRSTSGEHLLDRLVVCAGLHADRLARLAGDERGPVIVPFRGEYLTLRPERAALVRGLVYPVPDPRYPFLGVHFTRRIDGTVDVGPNAVLATAREGYRRRDVNPRDLWDTLTWPGFHRLARRHWRMGVTEVRGSLSERVFVAGAQRYIPEFSRSDVGGSHSGVRAQALDRDGSLVDDFRISRLGRVTVVRNAPSPAATSSLAIAEHVCDELVDGI
jgi:L-2-hydroxyglutarate oxidase LhgO